MERHLFPHSIWNSLERMSWWGNISNTLGGPCWEHLHDRNLNELNQSARDEIKMTNCGRTWNLSASNIFTNLSHLELLRWRCSINVKPTRSRFYMILPRYDSVSDTAAGGYTMLPQDFGWWKPLFKTYEVCCRSGVGSCKRAACSKLGWGCIPVPAPATVKLVYAVHNEPTVTAVGFEADASC